MGEVGLRVCSKCGILKSLEKDFNIDRAQKHGYKHHCKDCRNSYLRALRCSKPKKPRKLKVKKEKPIVIKKVRHKMSEEERRLRRREISIRYRLRNIEKDRAKKSEWHKRNKELNGETITEKRKARLKERWKNDPLYRRKKMIKVYMKQSLQERGLKKSKTTEKLLGCSFPFFMKYIERQFKKGMIWDNNSKTGWHIDHKIPLASAKTIEELEALWHYSNLQPLWAKENLLKGAKILPTQMSLLI